MHIPALLLNQQSQSLSLVGCGEARTASIEAFGLILTLVNNKTLYRVFDKRLTQHNLID
jgi:hypothetical protein